MAEANFEGFVAGDGVSRATSNTLVSVIGAVTTLALVIGAGVWGYKLAVRDASGVPVILAMEGPIRVAPEDAGGQVARHIGLSVNRIAAEGTAGEVPEEIILAEAPVDLDESDAAGIGRAAPLQIVEEDTKERTLALAEQLAREAPPVLIEDPEVEALAEVEDLDPLASAIAAAVADVVGAETPDGMRSSIRPQPRPRALMAAEAATAPANAPIAAAPVVASVAAVSASAELEAAALRPGMRLAQIGAYENVETARQEWDRVASRYPTLFEGKSRVIQTATSVGRTFYRLRVAGFESEDDSRRFCSAISGTDLRCITVTMR